MKNWTIPAVVELEVCLTANGLQGKNDEKKQNDLIDQGMQGNNPGVIKNPDDDFSYDAS